MNPWLVDFPNNIHTVTTVALALQERGTPLREADFIDSCAAIGMLTPTQTLAILDSLEAQGFIGRNSPFIVWTGGTPQSNGPEILSVSTKAKDNLASHLP